MRKENKNCPVIATRTAMTGSHDGWTITFRLGERLMYRIFLINWDNCVSKKYT